MSAEDRRVFKMDTVLALLADKDGNDVADMTTFLLGREVASQDAPVARNLIKAWIYSQHPAFMKNRFEEGQVYEEWVGKMKKEHGDNVSVPAIPAAEAAPVIAALDTLESARKDVADMKEQVAGFESQVAELEPFKGQAEELEKKVAGLEEKVGKLEEENAGLKKKTKEFEGKVPVNEGELESTVKDIVSKAVKDAVASMPVGAAAGAAVGEAAAEEPAEEESSAPDDFGFGSSGGDSEGFGF